MLLVEVRREDGACGGADRVRYEDNVAAGKWRSSEVGHSGRVRAEVVEEGLGVGVGDTVDGFVVGWVHELLVAGEEVVVEVAVVAVVLCFLSAEYNNWQYTLCSAYICRVCVLLIGGTVTLALGEV